VNLFIKNDRNKLVLIAKAPKIKYCLQEYDFKCGVRGHKHLFYACASNKNITGKKGQTGNSAVLPLQACPSHNSIAPSKVDRSRLQP
jgi:hypothetical protein